jgi:uncharacterized protein YdaU (DUF1376 family)
MTIKVRSVHFSPDEWLVGTERLTLQERGAFITICALIYSKGGPIDADERWLARCCRSDPRTVKALLRRLIELEKIQRLEPETRTSNGTFGWAQLMNRRCGEELKRALHRATQSRSSADLSAISRRSRNDRHR